MENMMGEEMDVGSLSEFEMALEKRRVELLV